MVSYNKLIRFFSFNQSYLFRFLFSITVPSVPPENIRCAPLTSQSLQISWHQPLSEYTNGLLQGYKIHYEHVADTVGLGNDNIGDNIEIRKTTEMTVVLTGLKKFANYSVQVLAYTRMGDGVLSKPTFCHTEEDGK